MHQVDMVALKSLSNSWALASCTRVPQSMELLRKRKTSTLITPFEKPTVRRVFKDGSRKWNACRIRHRFIWPLMDDDIADCSSISESMETNMGPVVKASPFSQFGTNRFKSLGQRLSLVAALQSGPVGVCVDAQSWEAQHATQAMLLCVGDTRAAINHTSQMISLNCQRLGSWPRMANRFFQSAVILWAR